MKHGEPGFNRTLRQWHAMGFKLRDKQEPVAHNARGEALYNEKQVYEPVKTYESDE